MVKYEIYKPVHPMLIRMRLFFERYWLKGGLILLVGYLFFFKDVSFQFSVNADPSNETQEQTAQLADAKQLVAMNTSLNALEEKEEVVAEKKPTKKAWKDRKANNFSNVGFVLNPTYAERHKVDPDIVEYHNNVCKEYIRRFAKVAIAEQRKYGIPASITLAQGLLESNAGGSRLSLESNNHFGIKCKRKCKGCTCRNYTDDSVYDMFRVFDSAWESYREHSILLKGTRYNNLFKLNPYDYEGWAYGLKKAGYATDPRYAYKLIDLIDFFQLYRFDKMEVK